MSGQKGLRGTSGDRRGACDGCLRSEVVNLITSHTADVCVTRWGGCISDVTLHQHSIESSLAVTGSILGPYSKQPDILEQYKAGRWVSLGASHNCRTHDRVRHIPWKNNPFQPIISTISNTTSKLPNILSHRQPSSDQQGNRIRQITLALSHTPYT